MAVLVGVFETQMEAEDALFRLREAGIREEEAVLIAGARDEDAPPAVATEHSSAAVQMDRPNSATPPPSHEAFVPDHPVSAGVTPPAKERDPKLDNAALGSAIGLLAGGSVLGPFGALAGAIAGGSIGAFFTDRGTSREDVDLLEDSLRRGRYVVAVDTPRASSEVRAILRLSGASEVDVRA